MLKLCEVEPFLTITIRATGLVPLTCIVKTLPMSSTVGAVSMVGRGASWPAAVNR